MGKTIKKPVPQSQIIPSTTVRGVNLADYTDYMSPVEKYITGDVNFDQWGEDRARNQSGFGKFAKSFGQAGGTFLTTVASTAGVLAGLAYAPVNEAMNEGDQDTMGDVFANPLVKAISDVDKYIKEDLMPVYYTKEQQNSIFSANTGTDLLNGLGFLASALVPNAMIGKVFGNLGKAVNAGKLGKLTGMLDDAVANGVIKVDEAGKMAGLVNAINATGNVTGALVSRLGESAIEANDSYETIVGTLKNKRNEALQQVRDYGYADNPNDLNLTDEEIKKIATEQRNNVFGGNMLVTISDFYQAGRFFGRNPLSDKILKNGLIHEAAKKTLGQKVLGYTGEALQEAGEEGYQFLLQKGAEKSATGNISFFKGISESTGDLFTTVEGQKSMLLGALLGGGASAAFGAMNEKSQNETLNSLVNNLNSNVDPKDAYVINEQGKRVIRPEFASQVTNFLLYEKMKDAALARNDREAYDLLEKKQFAETVAAKHQAGKLEEYIDELEVLGRSTPEEIKKILGENPIDENGKPLSPHEIATTKIAEARKIAKMIDGVSQIKEFARLSPQAKNHIAAMLVEQDVIAESHKNIVSEKSKLVNAPIIPSKKKVKIAAPTNEFGLSDLEVEEDDYSNPIENLRKKELTTKQDLLEKRYQEINETLKEYSKTPEKAEVKVAKEEQDKETAEKQIVKDNVDATNKAKSIKDKIDEAAKKNSLLAEEFKIVSSDGKNFFSSVDANGKPIIIDGKGNDVTLNFHKTYGNDYKITNLDYEEEGDGESNEEPEIVERDWSFKKPSPFATAGSSSTSKGTFNNLGDRRNLWLSKGRALFYEELNNIQDPLSLKLEIAPEYMYEELFLNDEGVYTPPTDTQLPVIIGYLYRKGKVVEKDGQKAYCVLHTSDLASNGSRFSDPNIKETLEEFQAFRDTIEDRFNKGQDSFVYINDISSGFINITSVWKPLKDILSSPAIKTGGVSIEVSMLSNDQKKPAIIIDGKDVKYVKWSGRPYIRVKVGDTASGPVYEYQELNTRNLNDAEIEQTVLPLILKYLEGNDTVELDGVKVDILTYNKTGKAKVPSILDAFLFFGTSKYSENTAIFFGKGVHARTLYFGSDANGAKFQISKNNLNNLEELKKFLKTKKRHVNKYYLPRMFTKMNIPTFSPSGDKMHEVSYLDLLAGNGPFEAGVTTNISSEGTVLNKYASFDSQIRENPNTTLKVKPRKVRKERDNGLENEEKEAINLTKPISKLQFYMLSSDEQQVYRENMQKLNDGNDETGTPMPEYDDLFKAFRKAMGEASKIAAGKGPDAIPVFPNFIDFAEEFYKDSPEKFEELKKLNNPTKAVFGKKPVKRKAYAKILDTSDKTLKIGSLVVHNDKEYVVIGIDGTVLTLTSAQGKGTQVATTTDKVFVKGAYPIQTFKKSDYIVVEKGVNDYFILSTTADNKGKPVYEGKGRIVKQTKGRIISLAKSKLKKQNDEIPWELEGTTENDLAVQIETVLSEIGAVIKNNGTEPVTEYVDNETGEVDSNVKNVVPPIDIPQDPGAKPINDDINDLFAREKSKEAPYIKGDVESAKKWMKDKMGVDVSIVDGLIYVAGYDKGLFGYFYNGAIVLSNAFEEGTEYHEAFHLVSQMYLSPSQRKSLYNEVRKKLNNYNLTDREAEEILAEDFREYVMTDGKIKYPEVQNNIFQKLLNFIKKLLGMKVETVNEIFAKINEGYYNKTKYINRLGKSGFFARTADLPNVEFSPTEHHNINEALLTYFRAFMLINKIPFYKIDVKTNMSGFEKMAIERFAAFPNSAFNKDPQWFLQHFKDNALAEISVELEVAEEEKTRDDAWVESYGKVSSFTGISDRIKFLFSSIVDNTSEKTEYALYKTIPFSEIKAYLTHMLHDKFSFAEMLEVLRDVASQTPNSIYEKKKISIAKQILQSIDIMDNNIEAVLFKTEFQDAMSLSKQPVITTLYYGNNTASTVDSMEQTVKNKMKSYWASKSMISSYISVLNGQRYISKANAESLIKMSIQEFANNLNLDIRGNLKDADLLKAIDVFRKSFFNLPTKVIKTGNPKVPEIQGFSAFMFNLEDYIKELADNDRSVREKIKAYYNSLDALMDLEAPLYDASVESQMKNSEGETIFGYVKPSYLYQRIKDIKDRIVQPTIAKGSELWEAIQYGRVTVVGVDGQRFSEQGEQGQHISTFTEEDMLLNRIVNLHQKNTVNFIQMADKKFVFGLKLDQESLIYSPDEIKFSDSDKLVLSFSESHRAIQKLWDMYQNYIAYDAKMKELNYYDESGSSAGIFEEMNNGTPFTDKKQFAEKLSQYLTVNYLETLQFTSEFIGSDSRDNIKSIIPKNITDSVAGDTMQDKIKSIVAGLVLTEFITNFEQMNVFFGAPSQYKALFKRSPAIRANGRLASTDDYVNEFIAESRKRYNMTAEQLKELPSTTHHFKSVVGKDVEVASTYAEDYASRLGHKQYDKINPVDAQGIITFEFYREYSIRTGQWSNENEDNFWKELKGESHSGLFPPMKLVHFGSETTDEQNVYYKFSVYPLLPSMIKGRQLEKIQQKLYNSGASMYIFESGNKVGAPKVKDDFYSEKVNEEATHILNVKDLKIQVDIAAKGEKMKQLFGTQLRKLINQNTADAGADIKDEKSSNEYTQTVNDLVSLEVESLSDFLDISVDELKQGNLNEVAWKKLIELFKESAIEREESDNIIIGLDYLKDQSLTIDVLPTRDKIQNLMNSLLNNRIQKQYMRGRSYVQASSVGFEYADEKSLKSAVNRGEILVDSHFYQSHFVNGVFDNNNARLGFLNVKDEKVYSAEILLPYIFKEMVQDINIITPELLEAIGYRIPTQGLNSMVSFKVVGFLPKSMDQLAAVPYEITMQSGSDFDVDKINMFLRNYFYNKKTKTFDSIIQNPEEYYASKVKKLESFISHLESIMVPNMELANIDDEYDEFTELLTEAGFKQNDYDKALDKLKRMKENPERFLKKYKKIFLQEKLFSLIRERLLDIDRFNDYINPNSAQDLEDQATEINNAQTAPYKLTADYKGIKQFFTSTNIKVAKNLWSAKQGVAQAASQGVFTALTQLNPIAQGKYSKRMYAPDGTFWTDEDGDIIFGKQNNTDGKSIMDIQANQHLTANVDAANKPFIFRLNANGITNDLHYYLISIGLPLPWVCRFMTQPIIIEYVKGMEKRKSMLNKLRRIQFNDNLTESDIVLKARAKFGGTSIPSEFLETEVDTDELHVPKENTNPKKYTQEQLLEIIKKPSLEQLDLLDDFLFYKEWATERRRIISSIKFDTEGAGKNLPESRISEYKYGRMVGSDRHAARTLYIGVEALVKNSMLKAFKENVLDLAITLYNNTVLIERQGHVAKQVLNDVFDMLYSKSQLNAENIYKIYGMLTNIILQNNLVDLDIQNDPIKVKSNYTKEDWWKEHMLSSTSVARQIASLIRSDVMKGNYLFDNLLTVDFATKDNEPDIIKFDNTVKIDADLEQVINDAFVDLKQKNPRLYQDLIKVSFFQTGVVQSVISFYKYIPVADFVAITRNLLKEPVISEKEMMAELVKNVHSIKGMANKVGRNDILDNKAGLPEFFTVDITNIKYRDSLFLTKTNQKNIALYERGLETSTTVRFNKINIKSTNKFNNGLVGQNFNIESENDETLEETDKTSKSTTSAWDMLTVAQSKKLNSVGITEKMFNSSTKEDQENLIKCNKPD